jgi:hypothetical protein
MCIFFLAVIFFFFIFKQSRIVNIEKDFDNNKLIPQNKSHLIFQPVKRIGQYLTKPSINNKNVQRKPINCGKSMSFLNVQSNLREQGSQLEIIYQYLLSSAM